MKRNHSEVQVMGIDAGGTMTDTFFVRDDGCFVVGKAQSNPGDESQAIYESSVDALAGWGRKVDDVYPELVTCVYSGTAMLNRVVQRKGLDVGLMVQSWAWRTSTPWDGPHRATSAMRSRTGST